MIADKEKLPVET